MFKHKDLVAAVLPTQLARAIKLPAYVQGSPYTGETRSSNKSGILPPLAAEWAAR